MPRQDVGGLEIFLFLHLYRNLLATHDWLGVTPSSVAAAKTLKESTGVSHVDADLENTPQPPTWRAKCRGIFMLEEHGYHTKDPKVSNAGG
jgi:hypothetical protein